MEDCARQRAYGKATDAIKTLPTLYEVELTSSFTTWANEVLTIAIVKDKL